jgi:hypothetical protein
VTDPQLATELEVAAAGNLKRVLRATGVPVASEGAAPSAQPGGGEPDWSVDPGTARMTAFLETKTVWHPIGL